MEETLGKRIAHHRKRLGMTQDALAEKLGITAQAISKWENDLSCPDISVLPKLAEIFSISTDELLGLEQKTEVHEGEVVDGEKDTDQGIFNLSFDSEENGGNWSFHWDSGRRQGLGFACWVLLLGGLMLADNILNLDVGFWSLAWPSFLLMLGLFGQKRFNMTSLGFVLLGGYFLADNLGVLPVALTGKILWPAFIILFGLSLLIDALRKPEKPVFRFVHNGNSKKTKSRCDIHGNRFECELSFGENTYVVKTSCLEGGDADVSFGDLTVDLSECAQVAPNCNIDAACAFGHLELRVPRRFRVEQDASSAFGSVQTYGQPDENPSGIIYLDASASFGEVSVRYI